MLYLQRFTKFSSSNEISPNLFTLPPTNDLLPFAKSGAYLIIFFYLMLFFGWLQSLSSFRCSVTRCWNIKWPFFSQKAAKISHRCFHVKMTFFKIAQKFPKYLAYFGIKLLLRTLKIAKSGHPVQFRPCQLRCTVVTVN